MQSISLSLPPQQRSKSLFPLDTRLHNQLCAEGELGSDSDDDDDDDDGDDDGDDDDDDDDSRENYVILARSNLYLPL